MSEQDEKAALTRRFVSEALQNPHNAALLERLPFLGLPDAWLVAGCLFQTVWNLRSALWSGVHGAHYRERWPWLTIEAAGHVAA